jgi:hypothetical protein
MFWVLMIHKLLEGYKIRRRKLRKTKARGNRQEGKEKGENRSTDVPNLACFSY